jgi:hypothetical protein
MLYKNETKKSSARTVKSGEEENARIIEGRLLQQEEKKGH